MDQTVTDIHIHNSVMDIQTNQLAKVRGSYLFYTCILYYGAPHIYITCMWNGHMDVRQGILKAIDKKSFKNDNVIH